MVNALKRAIYTGRISPAQAKRVDEMQAVADALSRMANIVMAWNTSQMQAVLDRWSNRRQVIPPELMGKIAPTKLENINLRGVFRFPVDRYADQILPSRPNAPITGTNGSCLSGCFPRVNLRSFPGHASQTSISDITSVIHATFPG